MKRLDNKLCQILFGSALAISFLSACTKELPYEQKLKDEVQEKSSIDIKSEYLYSSAMLNASRSSKEAMPFASGDNKRVKLEWTKDSLRILELERDARYQNNKTNDKLVLEIPVDHVDFQCSKDKYGECTNSEEERTDITWNQKGKFKFKLEGAKSGSLELLPILREKTFGEKSCHEEVSSRVLNIQVESDAINLQIERTFKVKLDCLEGPSDTLADATISAVYHHSMVKVESVLSKDFKPVSYPSEDQNTFGFFSTDHTVLDAAHNRTEAGKKTVMNHWNPNRKEIVYYLSNEFNHPENALVKELTKKSVKNLNDGLEKAGVQFRINLKEPAGKNPGDIRNSMIVLVEDPIESGVIGYGPQTEDPVTGEIISARTVMFLGTIKTGIGFKYDQIIRDKKRAQVMESQPPAAVPGAAPEAPATGAVAVEKYMATKISALKSLKATKKSTFSSKIKAFSGKVSSGNSTAKHNTMSDVVKDLKNYTKVKNDLYSGANAHSAYRYLQEAKNCAYQVEAASTSDISPKILNQFSADSKPWSELGDSEKQKVIDILLPEVWMTTLIHEIGHNLGLRHNFGGSEDKENFYTDAELKQMGIDHRVPFSSVMEYANDTLALHVLGKYDIAALRFAYAKKIELADGKLIDANRTFSDLKKSNDKIELKEYRYCTDEHTGINPGCRRFDLGTTYTEIVQNEIHEYLDSYEARNFRNGRSHFSLMDDPTYASGVLRRFKSLRLMQEIYERIKNRNGFSDDAPDWNEDETAKDLKNASLIAGRFLISVLETPDRTCLVAKKEEPKKLFQLMDLSNSEKPSCFDVPLKPEYVMLGQTGKSFKAIKDSDSENNYADQIDVRGYWLDKLMAARALFARQLNNSSLDKFSDNFADRSDLVDELMGTVGRLMLNQMVGPQLVETADGKTIKMDLATDFSQSHIVEQPLDLDISKKLQIPHQKMSFTQLLAEEIVKNMEDPSHAVEGKAFADSVRVIRTKVTDRTEIPEGYLTLDVGSDRLIAGPGNMIAQQAIAIHGLVTLLDKFERPRLVEIYRAIEKKETPTKLKEEEKELMLLDQNAFLSYLRGLFSPPAFYEDLLASLPSVGLGKTSAEASKK